MEMAVTDFHEQFIGKKIPTKTLKKLFFQICTAVHSCHQKRIAHLDIKPENILIDRAGDIKLCDFGSAVDVSNLPNYIEHFEFGSDFYSAPEIRQNPPIIGLEADMWSLGILLHVLVCGAFPFEGNNEQEMIYNYKNQNLSMRYLDMSKDISAVGKNLIRLLLKPLPKHRLSISQTINHPWFF